MDIARLETETHGPGHQTTGLNTMGTTLGTPPSGSGPQKTVSGLRRIESTAFVSSNQQKNWMQVVYLSRNLCRNILNMDQVSLMEKKYATQHSGTRAFVESLLKALDSPAPGYDWRFGPFARMKKLYETSIVPYFPMRKSPYESSFTSTQPPPPQPSPHQHHPYDVETLIVHYPFWHPGLIRNAMLGVGISFGCVVFVGSGLRTSSAQWVEYLRSALRSAKSWFIAHLADPSRSIVGEMFFQKVPRVADPAVVQDAKISLSNMVAAWRKDTMGSLALNSSTSPSPVLNERDYSDVSRAYEAAIVHPVRQLLMGDLMRLGLIKIQIVEAETLALANELDEIVASNHFNTQIMAAIPAITLLYSMVRVMGRFWRWTRDESSTKESAKRDLLLALWEATTLLIKEDDGPTLISFVTYDDHRAESEADGSVNGDNERFYQSGGANRPFKPSETTVAAGGIEADDEEEEEDDDEQCAGVLLLPETGQIADMDPMSQKRRKDAGHLIQVLHFVEDLLYRSRFILFRRRSHDWALAVQDVKCLFAREGLSSHARYRLITSLRQSLMRLE